MASDLHFHTIVMLEKELWTMSQAGVTYREALEIIDEYEIEAVRAAAAVDNAFRCKELKAKTNAAKVGSSHNGVSKQQDEKDFAEQSKQRWVDIATFQTSQREISERFGQMERVVSDKMDRLIAKTGA